MRAQKAGAAGYHDALLEMHETKRPPAPVVVNCAYGGGGALSRGLYGQGEWQGAPAQSCRARGRARNNRAFPPTVPLDRRAGMLRGVPPRSIVGGPLL